MSRKKREAGRAERIKGVEEKKEKGTFLSSSCFSVFPLAGIKRIESQGQWRGRVVKIVVV